MIFLECIGSRASLSAKHINSQGVSIAKAMLILFSSHTVESKLSYGVATKQNSGLPRPRDSLPQLAAICFARAPAASGKGKGTRSVANPGVAKRRALHGREKQRSASDCANPGVICNILMAVFSQS